MNRISMSNHARTALANFAMLFFMVVAMISATSSAGADEYFDNLKKGAKYTRAGNHPRALEAFKAAVVSDNTQLDGYFNAGNVARHLKVCRDVLLYFRGFTYLSPGTPDDAIAKAGIKECANRPGVGTLTLRSDPSGMEVIMDGAIVGKTPIVEERFGEGTYTISLTCRCPDYEDFSREITVDPVTPAIVDVQLTKKVTFGKLKIISEPAEGVTVFVNDKEVGKTPLEPLDLETKKHFIRLQKDGYDSWIRNVEVQRDRTVNVVATLEPLVPPASAQPVDGDDSEVKK